MKFLKNTKLVTGSALIVTGLTFLGIWCFRTPSREITRAELEQFAQAKALTDGRVMPTPYAGIYFVEGKHKLPGNSERVFLTTHLDEAQIKALSDQSWAKVAIPDQGVRGQWVNVLCNLLIAGVVIGVVVYQGNIGRGKNALVRERPTVSFSDVAGIEEAKGEVSEVVDFLWFLRGDINVLAGICHSFFEFSDALAQSFTQFRQFSRTEDYQDDNQNYDQVQWLKQSFKHSSPLGSL